MFVHFYILFCLGMIRLRPRLRTPLQSTVGSAGVRLLSINHDGKIDGYKYRRSKEDGRAVAKQNQQKKPALRLQHCTACRRRSRDVRLRLQAWQRVNGNIIRWKLLPSRHYHV